MHTIANKKADMPTGLLFFIVLALSIIALYSFVVFTQESTMFSEDTATVLNEVEFKHRFVLILAEIIARDTILESPNKNIFQGVAEEKEEQFDSVTATGNFFGKIRSNDFQFSEEVIDEYTLLINDLFVQAEKGHTTIKRNFDICMVFDAQGNKLRNCDINPE